MATSLFLPKRVGFAAYCSGLLKVSGCSGQLSQVLIQIWEFKRPRQSKNAWLTCQEPMIAEPTPNQTMILQVRDLKRASTSPHVVNWWETLVLALWHLRRLYTPLTHPCTFSVPNPPFTLWYPQRLYHRLTTSPFHQLPPYSIKTGLLLCTISSAYQYYPKCSKAQTSRWWFPRPQSYKINKLG